jgi:hypothetical protein
VRTALLVLVPALSGCLAESQVRDRASADFGCPEDQIEVGYVGAGAFRATGCQQYATYVCGSAGCLQNGARSGDRVPIQVVVPSAPEGPKKPEPLVVDEHGVAFELPPGFWRDADAKGEGEVYRDGKRHHAVRLRVAAQPTTPSAWLAAHHPDAKTWSGTVGNVELTFATKVGKSLRVTVAVLQVDNHVAELACSSDDLTVEKTDAVCAKILRSFRPSATSGGLPGE